MDLASLIGLIGGMVIIALAMILGGGFALYIDVPSIIITVGGSFFATLASVKMKTMTNFGKYMGLAIKEEKQDERKIISTIVSFSEKARREGILALEEQLEDVPDPFLKKGIQLAVDGTDPSTIKTILYVEVNQITERHNDAINMFGTWADMAPAYGMIGTLTGLIQMLTNMGGDQAAIGAGMSVALITTMYGSMIANAVMIPVKKKLEKKDAEEMLVKEIIIEGIMSIQSGDNPRMLEQKLLSFLPPKDRESQLGKED